MNVLDEIIAHKRKEVADRKRAFPIEVLKRTELYAAPAISLREYLRRKDKTGIIAEFKRKSPSKGIINANASVETTTRGYADAGASAISVLTDEKFFGGRTEDLLLARKANSCPILRKDFTIDAYQVAEAKSIGADAILLIAAVLDPAESKKLAAFAHELGMEVLLEVHNEEELRENLQVGADLIGVNNRDLKTFSVSIDVSKRLAPLMPRDVLKVSESGISNPEAIAELRSHGYEGFLIGENFMKHAQPEVAPAEFMQQLNRIVQQ